MILGDILYSVMPKNIKDKIEKDSAQWKIIVYAIIASSIFICLQTMKIVFHNSLKFMIASIVLTGLVIYFAERFL